VGEYAPAKIGEYPRIFPIFETEKHYARIFDTLKGTIKQNKNRNNVPIPRPITAATMIKR